MISLISCNNKFNLIQLATKISTSLFQPRKIKPASKAKCKPEPKAKTRSHPKIEPSEEPSGSSSKKRGKAAEPVDPPSKKKNAKK